VLYKICARCKICALHVFHETDGTKERVNTLHETGLFVNSEMSEKGAVPSSKNRERVSGSIFWRHSWHCSVCLPRESSLTRLTNLQLVRSWENMARAKTDK